MRDSSGQAQCNRAGLSASEQLCPGTMPLAHAKKPAADLCPSNRKATLLLLAGSLFTTDHQAPRAVRSRRERALSVLLLQTGTRYPGIACSAHRCTSMIQKGWAQELVQTTTIVVMLSGLLTAVHFSAMRSQVDTCTATAPASLHTSPTAQAACSATATALAMWTGASSEEAWVQASSDAATTDTVQATLLRLCAVGSQLKALATAGQGPSSGRRVSTVAGADRGLGRSAKQMSDRSTYE